MTNQALIRISDEEFQSAALSLIAAKRSEHTRKAYQADLAKWIAFCREFGMVPKEPTLQLATAFRDRLVTNLSRGTARRVLASLSGLYRVLLASRVVTANPFHPDVLAWPPETIINKTRLVAEDVADAMIANALADRDRASGARDAAILRMLYDTGLRRVSVAMLERSTYQDGTIRAVVKGDKEVEIKLPGTTIEALDRWLAIAPESTWVFPGADRHRALNPLTINKLVNERASAVGAKHVHPHCFRAAFITAAYDAGLPEYEIQAAVHHSDSKTTRRYDRGSRGKAVASQLSEFRRGRKP